MKKCVRCQRNVTGNDWHCANCGFSPVRQDGILRFAPDIDHANEGFKPEYFDDLYELESRNFWFKSRSKLIHHMIRRYFPGTANFLEIGCGTGYVISNIGNQFPAFQLTGGEGISAGLKFASRRSSGAQFLQMDARSLPYEDEFDLVGAFDVIEHIEEDELVLREMHAATRRGGGLIVTVPQHEWLWSYLDDYAQHKRRYSAVELSRKVKDAGYDILRMTSFVSLLLPAMFVSRLLNKTQSRSSDPTAELRMNSMLGFVFEQIMSLERALIATGVPFAAGGSLLLVARKP